MKKVTKWTGFFIIPIGILLFIQAYFFREIEIDSSIIAVSAAILGMLPRGLVLLISISLATGVVKLGVKKVLVQELYSVEMLAHVDTLCLDKTGTITDGKMQVSNIYILNDVAPIKIEKAMSSFCSNMEDNNSTFLALKEHFNEETNLKVVSKVPFSSERKWSGICFEKVGSFVCGAPEKLIKDNEFKLPEEVINAQNAGKRILLVGYTKEEIKMGELPELTIIAGIELDDPLKKNAKEMLRYFREQGVDIKIISGDNPLTVSSIAKQAGLQKYNSYIDLSEVKDEEIGNIVEEYSIFARVSPHQKSFIIKALQKNGHTVAMTGDGVNDVIALRDADCSMAMPNGSDAAKQISQFVFLESDFGVLKNILMEGRRIVNNITNVARLFFIKTIYTILLAILCILTGMLFPFMPVQITLIDAAFEAYVAFFLAFEPNQKRVSEPFLKTVLGNATPYALTIIFSIILIGIVGNIFNIPGLNTIMYLTMATVCALAVVKVCMPFNKLRIFLCSTSIVGFCLAAYLFRNILELEVLNTQGIILLVASAVICIPAHIMFTKNKFVHWNKILEKIESERI